MLTGRRGKCGSSVESMKDMREKNPPQITLKILCQTMSGCTFEHFQDVELGIQRGKESIQNVERTG